MSPNLIFNIHLVLGYVAWLLVFRAYIWPKLRAMEPQDAHRAIAALHGFRFFGLVFVMPGIVGTLPAVFAVPAAWGDLAAAVLALLALISFRVRFLFWFFVAAFNVTGLLDLLLNYYHAVRLDLPSMSGQLGAAYAIPILYVPILMITHLAAFNLLARPSSAKTAVAASAGQ